jgi:nucleotide-binding universal stress UspA family protein
MVFNKPAIRHILFATDLSDNANRAFEYAVSVAESYNADMSVLYVFEKLPPNAELVVLAITGYRDVEELREKSEIDLIKQIRTGIQQFCSEAADQIPACSLIVKDVMVETGMAVERILHYAGTGQYDMLVIGNRGLGLIQSTLMGSIARKVLQDSPIPVLVVPMVAHKKTAS